MPRAQGSLPTCPFSTLQLHPHAPPLLVVEAYFALARRLAPRPDGGSGGLHALHAAYTAAMDERREPDAVERWPADARDFYAALCVDPSADEEIIELAFALLDRVRPLPERSVRRYIRDEARRVLTNAQLRARYDEDRRTGTLAVALRPALHMASGAGRQPRKERLGVTKKKRSLFGMARERTAPPDARDARLLSLRQALPLEPDEPSAGELPAAPGTGPGALAEIVFTAGPRAGIRAQLNGNVISLADGRATASVWRHGDRFMLRHSGQQVRISGSAPSLAIVVLEDGDEIAVGSERARFVVLPAPS
ncbi:MAG: hypothetical protein HY873_07510 [Chloroflexi bacterium]|nr:hypothetical protein [Chloroflexota bacterium]